jgi:hypothetical protein
MDPNPFDDQVAFLLEHLVPTHRVVVAHDGTGMVGFLAARSEMVGHLYVRVDRLGEGIGLALLHLAKRGSSGRLRPYTFARNHQTMVFYERHGFVRVGGGFEPERQLEDVRIEWTLPAPACAGRPRDLGNGARGAPTWTQRSVRRSPR